MRTVRWITSGLALLALVPAVSSAQSNRWFKDSWFWGAKFGLMNFSTGKETKTAPLIGGEWLITKNRGALYLSAEQSFFTSNATVFDANGTPYNVSVRDMRRYTAAALAFPVAWNSIRPYGGVGFAMNLLQHATVTDPVTDPDQQVVVANNLSDEKDRVSFLMMGGVQIQRQRLSLFGQVTYMPSKANFLLSGRSAYFLEGGVRYNFGRASDSAHP